MRVNSAAQDFKEFEDAHIQCGIIGVTGTGKSSLINALMGQEIANVGVKETTGVLSPVTAYTFHNITLVDMPGTGTNHFQTDTYFTDLAHSEPSLDLQPKSFDFFIQVLANRVTQEDVKLYSLLTQTLGKKCFLVRSKFDIDADNHYRTKRKSEAETHHELLEDILKHFPNESRSSVFIISSAQPLRGDFEALKNHILKHLSSSQAEKFLAFSTAYSKEALIQKRKISERLATQVALLSACNSLNPIPGLDLAADVGLLLKLSRNLQEIYGLTDQQIDYAVHLHLKSEARAIALKRRVTHALRSYLTKEGIFLVLSKLAPKLEARYLAKLVPIAGHGLAMWIGYRLTSSFGKNAIHEFEKTALATLQDFQSKTI